MRSFDLEFNLNLSFVDWLFLSSLFLLTVLGALHIYAGYQAYHKGSSMNVFSNEKHWVPSTSKEITLLGVFHAITFAWWQSVALSVLLVITENPLDGWLGLIAILFTLPQLWLVFRYIGWNRVAKTVFGIHIIISSIWILFG